MSLRENILKVSKTLLIKDGFGKLSMRKIAKKADVTATSIYLHFENKDELLLALIDDSIDKLKNTLSGAIDPSKDLITQLEDLARVYIQFAIENPQEYEVIYMVRPEEMPKYPKENFNKIRSSFSLMAEIISKGKDENLLEVDDPKISAYSIWAQLHGVVSVILNKRLDTRIPRKTFINQSIDHILQGIINQKASVQR